MKSALLLVFIVLLISVLPAVACESSDRSSGQVVGYDAIQLIAANIPNHLWTSFVDGFDAWNNITCNLGNNSFPRLQTHGFEAGRAVQIEFFSGFGRNPLACGQFQGNRIELYEKARLDGEVVSCADPDIFKDTVTHELGHLLGLSDQSVSECPGRIMSQVGIRSNGTYVDRTITNAECALLRDVNKTPAELLREQCNINPDECFEERDCVIFGYCSPIVIDLDDGGFTFSSLWAGTLFDIDGDGEPERVAWIDGPPTDPFLAWDRNGNGVIDDGTELFGDATPFLIGDGRAQNGYQVLFELDVLFGNANGWIDEQDAIFEELLLWFDFDGDGRSQPHELRPLRESSIYAISVEYSVSLRTDDYGNLLRYFSRAFTKGLVERREVETVDVFFIAGPLMNPTAEP